MKSIADVQTALDTDGSVFFDSDVNHCIPTETNHPRFEIFACVHPPGTVGIKLLPARGRNVDVFVFPSLAEALESLDWPKQQAA